MDYEKKYNEALEQAKGYMDAGSSDLTDVLPEIFPELRESEDERIRKDIIGGLMWQRDNLKSEGPHDNNLILPGFCLTVGEHLKYLEKQKEHKSLNISAASEWLREHVCHYMNSEYNEFHKCVEYDGSIDKERLINDFEEAMQKEQKPAITSKFNVGDKIYYKGDSYNRYVIKEVREDYYINGFGQRMDMSYTDSNFELLEHLDDMPLVAPSKPIEWSEEDERIVSGIYAILEGWDRCHTAPGGILSVIPEYCLWLENRLKSLRSQPREEIYQSAKHDLAIRFMNYLDESRPEGKMGLSNGECEDIDKAFKENDWAKIVRYYDKYRPHWKPSEEQMKALADATKRDVFPNGYRECLETLYEQLKRL